MPRKARELTAAPREGGAAARERTTLDTQIGQTFAVKMGMNTYNIANTTAYRYYRLDITANNGATGVAVSELGLWGDSGRIIRDGAYQPRQPLQQR